MLKAVLPKRKNKLRLVGFLQPYESLNKPNNRYYFVCFFNVHKIAKTW